MKLHKINVLLHQVGIDTKAYKDYCAKLQEELDLNWIRNHTEEYWKYWHMCGEFASEYDDAIRQYHMTPAEAFYWVNDQYLCK